jgi:hypothetical protein
LGRGTGEAPPFPTSSLLASNVIGVTTTPEPQHKVLKPGFRRNRAALPAAIEQRAKKRRMPCGIRAADMPHPRLPVNHGKRVGKTDCRTSTATFAVNVSSQSHLFDCLTSRRCILYAGLPVNAHLPTFRFYCTCAAPIPFFGCLGLLFVRFAPASPRRSIETSCNFARKCLS